MERREDIRNGISRRTALKRIGAAGAIAWVTPVITSLRTPAFAQVSPGGGGSASIYGGDQTYYSGMCAVGGNPGPVVGTVSISADATNVYVSVTVAGLSASTSYALWINLDPGNCPLGGPNGGLLATDGSGNGSVGPVSIPRIAGATVAWISLTSGSEVYRSGTVAI